jgi:hypothetical protein
LKSQLDRYEKDIERRFATDGFWIRAPPPVSRVLRSPKPSPSPFYATDIFVWMPDRQLGFDIPCPSCGKLETIGHGKSDFRRVIGLDRHYFLVSSRRRCNACSASFLLHDRKVIASLPTFVQSDFPAWLTHRSGLDITVVQLMRSCFNSSMGPSSFAELLRENHTRRYHHLCRHYYSILHKRMERQFNMGDISRHLFNHSFESFSTFSDSKGYNGYLPSANYLSHVYLEYAGNIREFLDRDIMKRDSSILKMDHSFKVRNKQLY